MIVGDTTDGGETKICGQIHGKLYTGHKDHVFPPDGKIFEFSLTKVKHRKKQRNDFFFVHLWHEDCLE